MAYHNPNNPDALPWFAEPDKKGGAKPPAPPGQAYQQAAPPSQAYQQPPPARVYQQPPPAQHPNYHHQTSPQFHPQSQPPPQPQPQQHYHQPHQQQQYHYEHPQQHAPRPQHEPVYRQDGRTASPGLSPRDGYGGGSRVGLPTGPRNGLNTAPPPRSPVPPAMQSPPLAGSPQSRVVFQGDEELTNDQLRAIFHGLDTRGVGFVTEKQLAENLINSDRTKFDTYTINMMVRMFDSDRSGDLNFSEFVGLWEFLDRWRTIFNRFDTDRSGNISMEEFKNTLVSFQYRLSDTFIEFLFRNYDRENKGVITFDLFMQSCITLKRMTDTFKKYDDDRDGFITINFEDFVTEFLRQMKRVMIVDDGKSHPHAGVY